MGWDDTPTLGHSWLEESKQDMCFFSMLSLMFHRFVKLVLVAFEHSANTNEWMNELNDMKWNEMNEWKNEGKNEGNN